MRNRRFSEFELKLSKRSISAAMVLRYKVCLLRTTFRRLFSTTSLQDSVRVRFAPSPTGFLHLGGLRTALYNFIYAKSLGGKFILRIEDTDQTRLVPGALDNLHSMLEWSGLVPDEGPLPGGMHGPYVQSERLHLYNQHIQTLLENGTAYKCFCSSQRLELLRKAAIRNGETPRYDNKCRHLTQKDINKQTAEGKSFVIRFKLNPGVEPNTDLVYGRTLYDAGHVEGDPVLMKSDGFPTYHFANVVDDHLMEISHVLRGQEWLASVSKHLSLYQAFGWKPPNFAHLPLLMNKDGTKLSKRQGDIFVENFKDQGYMSEAVLNFITFCGSGFDDNRKIRNLEQLIADFSLEKVTTHSAMLDMDLLDGVNRGHISRLMGSDKGQQRLIKKLRDTVKQELGERTNGTLHQMDDDYLRRVLLARKDHIGRLKDLTSPDYAFLWLCPDLTKADFSSITQHSDVILSSAIRHLGQAESFTKETLSPILKQCFTSLPAGLKYSHCMKVLRVAMSGLMEGPPVAEMMEILGGEETVRRLEAALDHLQR
ncbi:probable glutamate--tRNA ligase, mitochondrial isoform X2 [Strongylocentrotus purpuratus]|uniref:Nondiscriminating glutamyl-tRNA synthetase EARS2, mitochondrial n=1 Tax=Strongylocentrotus purpuratus TaxID=7668 RepID=A0A7M7NK13_STRPU|nr:probable glutamate--tRNA ligase, mitochondrial isoform X2 [Strongylocentrotus purpuratus]